LFWRHQVSFVLVNISTILNVAWWGSCMWILACCSP
jgi:hypothetical protein